MDGITPKMDGETKVAGGYTTAATSKGKVDGTLSAQWAARPADQRFTTLEALIASVKARTDASSEGVVQTAGLRVVTEGANLLLDDGSGAAYEPTHWSFGQLCSLADGTSADQMRKTASYGPTGLKVAAAALQLGIKARGAGTMAAYTMAGDGYDTLRAMTSEKYARIRDLDVANKVADLVKKDDRWKVPGMIDWSSQKNGCVTHNPFVDVTTDNTTLYASDRDVFIFMCQDAHPIEVGKLDNGDPDLMFRGFIVSNSEVGAATFTLRTFLLRGVCMNRNLWGTESQAEISIRHIGSAVDKFEELATPALEAYADADAAAIVGKVHAAKAITIAKTEGERIDFLMAKPLGFSRTQALKVMARVNEEEGHPLTTVWDAVQGVTALARKIEHQDVRVKLEALAGRLMEKVTA